MDRNKEALARLEGALEGVSPGTLDIRVFSPEGGEGEMPRRLFPIPRTVRAARTAGRLPVSAYVSRN